jgi:hypothetical protein
MISITLTANDERPAWWHRFLETIPTVDRSELNRYERNRAWFEAVNVKLMESGGRVQRVPRSTDLLMTFRLDSNYTMFMLKYS